MSEHNKNKSNTNTAYPRLWQSGFSFAVAFWVMLACTVGALAAPVRRVHNVDISISTATVRVNQQLGLWAQAYPLAAPAADREITWHSSSDEVVEIAQDGTLTGVSPGTAVITAEAPNGTKATCTVTVPARILAGMEADITTSDLPQTVINGGASLSAARLRLDTEEAIKAAKKDKNVRLVYRGKSKVSPAAARAAAYTAALAEKTVTLRFQTLTGADPATGKKRIQGQLTMPADADGWKNAQEDVLTGVFTAADKTTAYRIHAEKALKHPVEIIRLAQDGSFPAVVEIAANVDRTRLKNRTLALYFRDSAGQYKLLAEQDHFWDTNGYLHFSTATGGIIAVAALS